MSEVEKMYENAGVGYGSCQNYSRFEQCCNSPFCDSGMCPNGISGEKHPFTAKKQIAILMFILNKFGDIGFQKMYSIRGNDENTRKDFIKCLCDCEHETWDSRPVDFYYQKGASGDNLKESLAGLINNLWQDLTEQERTEIAEILRG